MMDENNMNNTPEQEQPQAQSAPEAPQPTAPQPPVQQSTQQQAPVTPQQPVQQPPVAPQQPVQPQPAPMAPDHGKNMSIAALVCGILGIVGAWIPVVCYFTLVLSILGIIFGAKGMKGCPVGAPGRGLAIAGLVLGIIGTVFGVIGAICYSCTICIACGAASTIPTYYY